MKNIQTYLPSGLLFSYIVYSAFVPVTIAHSIIVLSLAGLFGFQSHISRLTTTKHNKEVLDSLKNEMELKLNEQKEFYEKRFSKLEDEVGKMALNTLPQKAASSPIPQARKMVF